MGNCLSIGRGILLCIKLGTAAPPSIPIRHTLVGISLVPPFTFPYFNCKYHHCNDKRGKHLHRNKKPKPVPRGEINVIREDIFQMKGVKQGVHQDKKDKIQQRSPQNVLWLPNAQGRQLTSGTIIPQLIKYTYHFITTYLPLYFAQRRCTVQQVSNSILSFDVPPIRAIYYGALRCRNCCRTFMLNQLTSIPCQRKHRIGRSGRIRLGIISSYLIVP